MDSHADNELAILSWIHRFGHLRKTEILRLLDPVTPARVRRVRQALERLVEQDELIERVNPTGTGSFLLSAKGARRLRWLSPTYEGAKSGGPLSSVSGPTFYHRTLGTLFLVEMAVRGHAITTEHEIQQGRMPIAREPDKVPDGLYVHDGRWVWVEVESSRKPKAKFRSVVDFACERAGTLPVAFVFDPTGGHEARLRRAIDTRVGAADAAVWARICFARLSLDRGLTLSALEIVPLAPPDREGAAETAASPGRMLGDITGISTPRIILLADDEGGYQVPGGPHLSCEAVRAMVDRGLSGAQPPAFVELRRGKGGWTRFDYRDGAYCVAGQPGTCTIGQLRDRLLGASHAQAGGDAPAD
ncbi:MAG: hypothetical protein M0037_12515 [Betaproteobacteria bacterium]|nr:hypothetical protein [Betaproteobacteria bacterium]